MYDPFAPLDPSSASWNTDVTGGSGFGGVRGWSNLGLPVPTDLLHLSQLSGYGGPAPSTPAYSYYLALQQGAPFGGYASTPAQTYYQARQQEALGSSAMSDPFGGQTAGYLGDGGGFSNMYAPYGSSPSDANGGSSSGLGNTPYFFTDAHSHHGPGAAAAPAASSGIKSGSWQFQQFPGAPAIANPAAGSTMPVAQASPFGNAAIAKSPSTVIGPGTNRDQQFIGPPRPTSGHAGISPPPPPFSDAALAQWRNTPVRPDEKGKETNVPKAVANQVYDYSNSALGVFFAPANAAVGAVTHDPALQAQASHDLSTGLPVVTGGGLVRMLQNSADPVGDLTRWVHNNPTDAIASGLIGAALHGGGGGIGDSGVGTLEPVASQGLQAPTTLGNADDLFNTTAFNGYDYANDPTVVPPLPLKLQTMDSETPVAGTRGTAVKRAERQERQLFQQYGAGTRPLTKGEIDQFMSGVSLSDLGYAGHHLNRVKDNEEWQGDPRNIYFLRQGAGDEHMELGHRGGTRAPQPERFLVDRQHMLDHPESYSNAPKSRPPGGGH